MSQDQQPFNHMATMAEVVGKVGCVNIALIGLGLGAGILLDRLLGTDAIFTVLFIVGSVPLALYVTVRVSMSAAARVQKQIDANKAKEEPET